MTNERALEILKRYTTRIRSLEEHAFPDLEETEALFVAYKALEQLERLEDLKKLEKKPEPIPIIQTSDGTVWPLSVFEPTEPTPEAWKAGAELCKLINGIFEKRMKELELERERKEGAKND